MHVRLTQQEIINFSKDVVARYYTLLSIAALVVELDLDAINNTELEVVKMTVPNRNRK